MESNVRSRNQNFAPNLGQPRSLGAGGLRRLVSWLGEYCSGVAFAALVLGAVTLTAQTVLAASDEGCGSEQAVATFESAADAAVALLPTLNADVDRCFNPDKPAYVAQTHKILTSVQSQYQQSALVLQQAERALEQGKGAEFSADVMQVVANITSVNQPIFQQASNLRNFGFTTSDAKVNGSYRYPTCNSTSNDQPAQNFAKFYAAATSLRQSLPALSAAADCAK